MSAAHFGGLMNQFYAVATQILVDTEAFIDKVVGDEVMAVFIPAFTGPNHARSALQAAQGLLRAAHAPGGFDLPVGVGVHTGPAFFGTVTGAAGSFSDLTALGDTVNLAARLASLAGPGEALVGEPTYAAAQLDVGAVEKRTVTVKGKREPVTVRVLVTPSDRT